MKAKNHIIYGDDATLRRLKADYDFIGRQCEIRGDRLIVFALPQKREKKKEQARGKRRD